MRLEKWFLNGYANQGGRTELNFAGAQRLNDNVSTGLLLHGNLRPLDIDNNKDGFLDFPTGLSIEYD